MELKIPLRSIKLFPPLFNFQMYSYNLSESEGDDDLDDVLLLFSYKL